MLGGAAVLGDRRTSLEVVSGDDCHHRWVGNSKVLLEEQVRCLDSVLGRAQARRRPLCAPPQRAPASALLPPSRLRQGRACLLSPAQEDVGEGRADARVKHPVKQPLCPCWAGTNWRLSGVCPQHSRPCSLQGSTGGGERSPRASGGGHQLSHREQPRGQRSRRGKPSLAAGSSDHH